MHSFFIASAIATALSLLFAFLAEKIMQPISIIGSFLQLHLVHNSGIAFSLALPSSIQTWLIITGLISVCIAAHRSSKHDHLTMTAYGLIVGGALGNIIDRLPDGLVTDFIAIGTFPIFNVADICICIGAGLLLLDNTRASKPNTSPIG